MNSKEKTDFKYGMEGLSDEELLLVDNFKFSFNITNERNTLQKQKYIKTINN